MARPKNKRKYIKSGKYKKADVLPKQEIKHIATHNEQPKQEKNAVAVLEDGLWFPDDFIKLKELGNFMVFIEKGKLINLDKIAKEL